MLQNAPVLMNLVPLLDAARAGDPQAREALLLQVYPRVRALVHSRLQQDFRQHKRWMLPLFSTSDIVQEVFFAVVHQGIDGFAGEDDEALLQYLGAVVRHRLVDAVRHYEAERRDARRVVGEGEAQAAAGADPTPSLHAAVADQLRVYREVVDSLAAKESRLITLRLEAEQSFAAIAEELDIASADAARQAFRAAKARLLVRLRARGVHLTEEGA